MDMILIKILAAFLALSQVVTRPDAIKMAFDQAGDQAAVTQILRDGCGHMRKAFDVEFGQTTKWDGDQLIVISAFYDADVQRQQIGLAQ